MKLHLVLKDAKKTFYYLTGINRSINPSHVTKLCSSIQEMGVVRPVIVAVLDFIDGVKRTYIIDGQHLINACIREHRDIPYIFIDIKDKADLIEKIALLNASSKSWVMLDYITAWSFITEDYKKLNNYYNIYDLELCSLAEILTGESSSISHTSSTSRKIKKGAFKITNEAENVDILNKVTDVLKIIPRMDRTANKYAVSEYVSFLRNSSSYDHKKFLKNLEIKKNDFVLATQEQGKLKEMFSKLSK
jgi:ParB-like nuclease domain